jgi:hypothetical protein
MMTKYELQEHGIHAHRLGRRFAYLYVAHLLRERAPDLAEAIQRAVEGTKLGQTEGKLKRLLRR